MIYHILFTSKSLSYQRRPPLAVVLTTIALNQLLAFMSKKSSNITV